MNLVKFGTDYGGWAFDLDNIKDGDVVLDCGVGNDISFALELCKVRQVRFVFVDPELENLQFAKRFNLDSAQYVQAAVGKENGEALLFMNKNIGGGSNSLNPELTLVGGESITVPTVTLKNLLDQFNPNIVKLDIEGAEYDVYKDLLSYDARQIAIEFHHRFLKSITMKDTKTAVQEIADSGYTQINDDGLDGITFLRN